MSASERYAKEWATAIEAAQAAGALLLSEFHRGGGPRGPRGKCPADDDAEKIIRERLSAAFPTFGQCGEEIRALDRPPSDSDGHLWQIDPNDGTSAFQRGCRGAAVSLGLLRRGRPVLGVVFAYGARAGRGDLLAWAEGGALERNGHVVPTPSRSSSTWEGATVFVSHAADSRSAANADYCAPGRFRALPSIAYRLALAAAGEGVAGLSLNSPYGWDVAGGHALLTGASQVLVNEEGREVEYDERGASRVGNCWGGVPEIVRELAGRDVGSLLRPAPATPTPYPLIVADPCRIVTDAGLLDRAQACLVGQLAGDNLGALVEFQTPEQVRLKYPRGPRALRDGGCWDILAGQPTDDSELALMLARSIIQSGGYDVEAAARSYVWWLASSPFDVGNTTRAALSAGRGLFEKRAPLAASLEQAAGRSASQANGALMRVSPLAIHGHSLPETVLAELARQDARLTHAHPVCQDASAVFCVAIAYALRTGAEGRAVYDHALGWARTVGLHADVLAAVVRAEKSVPSFSHDGMGWVLRALQIAFHHLRQASSLEEALAETILLGGDTDTNGAIVGALVGAVLGMDSVPHQWLDRLLTCRPLPNMPNVRRPRPAGFWPVDCLEIAELLVWLGKERAERGG